MGVNRALVGVADGKGKRSFERETERGGGKSVVARVLRGVKGAWLVRKGKSSKQKRESGGEREGRLEICENTQEMRNNVSRFRRDWEENRKEMQMREKQNKWQ